jgi:hypothetical protein
VATGEIHTCVVLDDHDVKCWGSNSYGQLGYGDVQNRGGSPADMGDALPIVDLGTGRIATAIAASRYSTCAILDDGSLKCWGWIGLLGHDLSLGENVGDQPGEMGDQLPALDFGGRKAVHLAMGETSACASMEDDTLWCWGVESPWLQFWLPTKRVSALGPSGDGVAALYEDGTLSPQLPNGMVPVLTSVHKALAVAGGFGADTCVLLDDGSTVCVAGDGTLNADGPLDAIAIGVERGGGLCSALSDGSVWCHAGCIFPIYYQCSSDGSFVLGKPAAMVTSNGSQFACALLADGNIKCWDQSSLGESEWLGSEIAATTQADGGITYGAWHVVDLGTHP